MWSTSRPRRDDSFSKNGNGVNIFGKKWDIDFENGLESHLH